MRHTSTPLDTPVEFVQITKLNPFISKCIIKVCYVQDTPNRNKSVITKDVAKEMAHSLPGSPIVGHYDEANEDFDEHNRIIEIAHGTVKVKDNTRPYGFVGENAKVWFQWFHDDDGVDREYLCTEGFIWTKAYPESQKIIDDGKGQSMELDEETLDASWSNFKNSPTKFFIINEAFILKLCVLGENAEPCFEGASVTAPTEFSFEPNFKQQLFTMMSELTELLKQQKGGEPMFTTYAVEIGDALWTAIYDYLYKQYPEHGEGNCCCGSLYRIEGVYEEGTQKFVILQERVNSKYFRLNFSLTEAEGFVPSAELTEVTKTYVPAEQPQFSLAAVEEYENNLTAQFNTNSEDNSNQSTSTENQVGTEGGENNSAEGEQAPATDPQSSSEGSEPEGSPENDNKTAYSLDEIPEYVELANKFAALEIQYNSLVSEKETFESTLAAKDELIKSLTEFKVAAERKDKQAMIDSFYMLNDEDKADVIANIDTYSLEDIEAKLCVICVRNKVNFNLENDNTPSGGVTFNLDNHEDDSVPAWAKAALEVAKTMN